jgi:hypothetical protein
MARQLRVDAALTDNNLGASMKTMKIVASALVVMTVLPGCATRPVDIAPQHVSAMRYDDRTCRQLLRELDDVDSQLGTASVKLDSKATQDAWVTGVGAVLLWPVLFALGGNQGMEQEVARLKGEQLALRKKMRDLNCDDPKPAPAAPQPVPIQPSAAVAVPVSMTTGAPK